MKSTNATAPKRPRGRPPGFKVEGAARLPHTSFRLSTDTRDILAALALSIPATATSVVEQAIRYLGRREGIDDADAARRYLEKRGQR